MVGGGWFVGTYIAIKFLAPLFVSLFDKLLIYSNRPKLPMNITVFMLFSMRLATGGVRSVCSEHTFASVREHVQCGDTTKP